jgi:hypothetical protein
MSALFQSLLLHVVTTKFYLLGCKHLEFQSLIFLSSLYLNQSLAHKGPQTVVNKRQETELVDFMYQLVGPGMPRYLLNKWGMSVRVVLGEVSLLISELSKIDCPLWCGWNHPIC